MRYFVPQEPSDLDTRRVLRTLGKLNDRPLRGKEEKIVREVDVWVKFMKKEERAIFKCYYEARSKARMQSHVRNLDFVRDNLIEGNRDLTKSVWNVFLDTLVELECDIDWLVRVIKIHPEHPGKGNSYKIPSKDKDRLGHIKQMNARKNWRAGFRAMYAPMYGFEVPSRLADERVARLSVIEGGVR